MKRFACLVLTLAACGTTAAPSDELAGETAADDTVADQKSDSPYADAYTYFEIRTDMRKCAFPACGGFFLSRLNRTTTKCSSGSYDSSCYTPSLEWSQTDLVDDVQAKLLAAAQTDASTEGVYAIVRGWFRSQSFVVTEAWVAENDTVADGVFVKLNDNGIRCITAPCPSTIERGLNTVRYANIDDLDWSGAGLTDREIEGFQTDIGAPGVILAGWRYYATSNGHTTKNRTVTAAYHRLANPAAN
jgi:hypothetical protein